jgi:hypothetical protein
VDETEMMLTLICIYSITVLASKQDAFCLAQKLSPFRAPQVVEKGFRGSREKTSFVPKFCSYAKGFHCYCNLVCPAFSEGAHTEN